MEHVYASEDDKKLIQANPNIPHPCMRFFKEGISFGMMIESTGEYREYSNMDVQQAIQFAIKVLEVYGEQSEVV